MHKPLPECTLWQLLNTQMRTLIYPFLHGAVLGSGRLELHSVVAGDAQTLTYISLLVWVIKITNEITVNWLYKFYI